VEPVEINTGEFYLRQLRADRLMDDRPALIEGYADPTHRRYVLNLRVRNLDEAAEYVEQRAAEWAADRRCSWAIAEPTTGDLLGEVGLKNLDLVAHTAESAIWVHPRARGRGVASTALSAALRFGFGALGLETVGYEHEESNVASAAVARRCEFTLIGANAQPAPTGEKVIRWSRASS
jgi:RimJ/RimL family protein N-acetyltransferase